MDKRSSELLVFLMRLTRSESYPHAEFIPLYLARTFLLKGQVVLSKDNKRQKWQYYSW